jgi:hypothetical protein
VEWIVEVEPGQGERRESATYVRLDGDEPRTPTTVTPFTFQVHT